MSSTIDDRVVKMTFDNASFEKNIAKSISSVETLDEKLQFQKALEGISALNEKLGDVDFKAMESSVSSMASTVSSRFSNLGVVATTALVNIADKGLSYLGSIWDNTMGTIIEGGRQRAQSIEDARFMLQGLLGDEEAVQDVLDRGLESVAGTAYGFDQAAKAASSFVASGIQGEQLTTTLNGLAGITATLNGDYQSMADLLTTIAGNGRIMTQQMNSFSSRGFNAAAAMSAYVKEVAAGMYEVSEATAANITDIINYAGGLENVTESIIREYISEQNYNIEAETFLEMLADKYGEHAKDANKTVTGAAANIQAALKKIGQNFWDPIIAQDGPLVKFYNALRVSVNALKEATYPFVMMLSSAYQAVLNFLSSFYDYENDILLLNIGDYFTAINNILMAMVSFLKPIGQAFAEVFGAPSISSINELIAGFLAFTEQLGLTEKTGEALKNIFVLLFRILKPILKLLGFILKLVINIVSYTLLIASKIIGVVVRIVGAIAGLINKLTDLITSLKFVKLAVSAVSKIFKTLSQTGTIIFTVFDTIFKIVEGVIDAFKEGAKSGTGFANAATNITKAFKQYVIPFLDKVSNKVEYLNTKLQEFSDYIASNVEAAVSKLYSILKPVVDVIADISIKVGKIAFGAIAVAIYAVYEAIKTVYYWTKQLVLYYSTPLRATLEAFKDIWVSDIQDPVNETIDFIQTKFQAGFKKLQDTLDEVKDKFLNTGESAKEFGKEMEESNKKALESSSAYKTIMTAWDNIKSFFNKLDIISVISTAFEKIKSVFLTLISWGSSGSGGVEAIVSIFQKLGEGISSVLKFIGIEDVQDLIEILQLILTMIFTFIGVDMLNTLSKTNDLLETLNKTARNVFYNIKLMFSSITTFMRELAAEAHVLMKAEILLKIAEALLMIAIAIKIIGTMDTQSIVNATTALSIFAVMMLKMLDKITSSGTWNSGAGLVGLAQVIDQIAKMMLLIGISLRLIAPIAEKDTDALSLSTATLVTITYLIMRFLENLSKEIDPKKTTVLFAAATAITEISKAMIIMGIALKILASIYSKDSKAFVAGSVALVALLFASAAILRILTGENKSDSNFNSLANATGAGVQSTSSERTKAIVSGAGAIISIAEGLVIMAAAVAILSAVARADMKSFLVGAGVLALMLGLVMLVLKMLTGENNQYATVGGDLGASTGKTTQAIVSGAGAIVSIATALVIMAGAIAILSAIYSKDAKAFIAGAVAVAVLLGIIGGILKLLSGENKTFKSGKDTTKETNSIVSGASAIILIAAAVVMMAHALEDLASIENPDNLVTAALALFGGLAAILAAMTVMSFKKDIDKTVTSIGTALLTLSVGMVALALALRIVSTIPWDALKIGLIGLGLALVAFVGIAFLINTLHLEIAFIVLGIAFLSFGDGLLLVATAMVIMTATMIPFTAVMLASLGTWTVIVAAFMETMLNTMVTFMPRFISAIAAGIIDSIRIVAQNLLEALGELIIFLAQWLDENLPVILQLLVQLNILLSFWVVNLIYELLVAINEQIVPIINELVLLIINLIEGLAQAIDGNKEAIVKALFDLVGAIINLVIEVFKQLFAFMVPLFEWVLGFLQPVIDAIGFAISWFWENILKPIIDAIGAVVTWLWENILSPIINGIVDLVKYLISTVKWQWENILKPVFDVIISVVTTIVNAIAGAIRTVRDAILGIVAKVKEVFTGIVNWIKNFFGIHSPSSVFASIGTNIMQGLINGLKGLLSSIWEFFKGLGSKAIEKLKDGFSKIKEVGKNILEGLKKGLTEGVEKVTDAAKNVASNVVDGVKNFFGINSPSKVFAEIGQYCDEGLANGLTSLSGLVGDAGEGVGESAIDGLTSGLSNTSDILSLSDMLDDDDLTITPVVDMTNVENSADDISAMFGGSSFDIGLNSSGTTSASLNNAVSYDTSQDAANFVRNGAKDVEYTGNPMTTATNTNNYNFVQNNYSPTALSRTEIYRDTKNQISQMKEATGTA